MDLISDSRQLILDHFTMVHSSMVWNCGGRWWWLASNVLQSHTDSNVLFASRFCLVQRQDFPRSGNIEITT